MEDGEKFFRSNEGDVSGLVVQGDRLSSDVNHSLVQLVQLLLPLFKFSYESYFGIVNLFLDFLFNNLLELFIFVL